MSNIDVLISKKCREFFSKSKSEPSEDLTIIIQEIKSLKTSKFSFQNDFKSLSNQADHTLDILTCIAQEYDDILQQRPVTSRKISPSKNLSQCKWKLSLTHEKANQVERKSRPSWETREKENFKNLWDSILNKTKTRKKIKRLIPTHSNSEKNDVTEPKARG